MNEPWTLYAVLLKNLNQQQNEFMIYVLTSAELKRLAPMSPTAIKLSLKSKRQKRCKDGRFAKPLPKAKDVEKNPLVTFWYPASNNPGFSRGRTVRLISASPAYLIGLELQGDGSWKYKKFLQHKAKDFGMVSFNLKAMS